MSRLKEPIKFQSRFVEGKRDEPENRRVITFIMIIFIIKRMVEETA